MPVTWMAMSWTLKAVASGAVWFSHTIVNRDQLVPVVLQHDTLQKTLAGLLEKVGLERKPVPVEDLHAYIARREAGKAPAS